MELGQFSNWHGNGKANVASMTRTQSKGRKQGKEYLTFQIKSINTAAGEYRTKLTRVKGDKELLRFTSSTIDSQQIIIDAMIAELINQGI